MSDISKIETSSEVTLNEAKEKQQDIIEVKEESAPAIKSVETKKTATVTHNLYIQYNDLEFSDNLMFEAAVNAYCNKFNQDKSCVETVNLYVKPQEGKAYYVINNDAKKSGSIDL